MQRQMGDVQGGRIANWCMADCVVGHRAEVGVQTDERYRRRGLAKRVVAAAVEHCLAHEVTHIGWHCGSANLASAATATAVGFREVRQHPYVNGWINHFEGVLVHGNQCLVRQQYGAAAEWYERAFAEVNAGTEEVQRSAIVRTRRDRATYHYKAACAWSQAGDTEAASRNLEKALEHGTEGWMLCWRAARAPPRWCWQPEPGDAPMPSSRAVGRGPGHRDAHNRKAVPTRVGVVRGRRKVSYSVEGDHR